MSRRPLGLLMVVVVAALVLGGIMQRDEPKTARATLTQRLDAAEAMPRFAMHYERGGTRVLDCIAVNLRYTARIDSDAERMVVTTAGADQPILLVDPSRVLMHRSLFQPIEDQAEWLSLPRPFAPAARTALSDVLGVDLGATVSGARLPASGNELARAALDVARSVRRLAPNPIDGNPADRYRIEVARAAFEREADTAGVTATVSSLPVMDIWLDDDNDVRRVAIRPQAKDGSAGPAEDGWTMDFTRLRTVDRPDPGRVARLTTAALTGLRAATPTCKLDVGRTDN